jgi:putative nucleotidyltransferase with HDIG domain
VEHFLQVYPLKFPAENLSGCNSNGSKHYQIVGNPMAHNIIVLQPEKDSSNIIEHLLDKFNRDAIIVSSFKELQENISSDVYLIFMEITIFGKKWIQRISDFQVQYPHIQLILTSNKTQELSVEEIDEYQQWDVTRKPYVLSPEQISLLEEMGPDHETLNITNHSPKPRLPIRLKITLPYILLALALAIAASIIVTRLIFDSIEERFLNQLIETGKISSEWIVTEEDHLLESLRLVANTNGIDISMTNTDTEELRNIIYPIAVNNQIEAIEILDANGIGLISARHKTDGGIEEYLFASSDNTLMQWDFIQNAVHNSADDIGNKFAGITRASWGDYFYIAGPIFNSENEVIGAVLVGETLSTLARKIREATLAQVSIYTFDGEPIATTFLSGQALDTNLANDILIHQDQTSYQRELNVIDIDYREIVGPWEVRYDADLGLMGVALPENVFVHLSQATRWQIVVIVSLAFLLVVFIGFLISNSITNPLLKVVKASSQVAQGNLQIKVESSGNDEVTFLAQTFNHMISELDRSNQELLEAYDSSLEGWSRALELRDYDTDDHSRRVVEMTMRLADELGIDESEKIHVRRGALLHDIGKMGVPDNILLKPGPLTEEEWAIMRKHPVYAYNMLKSIRYLRLAIDIPYCHHERWDGSGYPNGLRGEEIPLPARIFSVVDVWDALTSNRPYRKAWPIQKALEYIQAEKDHQFDPMVVDALVKILSEDGIIEVEKSNEFEMQR